MDGIDAGVPVWKAVAGSSPRRSPRPTADARRAARGIDPLRDLSRRGHIWFPLTNMTSANPTSRRAE